MTENKLSFAAATRRAIATLRDFSFSTARPALPADETAIPAPRNFSTSAVVATVLQTPRPESFSFAARYRTALLSVALLFVSFGFLAGCHSNFVQTTIVNRSGAPLRLVELDYPSASLGTTNLNNAAEYHYRFKITGSGTAKLDFVDSTGKTHHSVGPELDEGQEGSLLVSIDESNNVIWTTSFPVNK
jgi:hypothetical protein